MADSDSGSKHGEKRPADSKPDEKRRPKVRRFDVKTRVPRAKTTDVDIGGDSQNVNEKDRTVRTEKGLVITTVIVNSEGSKTVSDGSLPTTVRPAEVSQRLGLTETAGHEAKSEVSAPKDPAPETMSVNQMLQTSLELQQAEIGNTDREERGPTHHRNIVDQLFQDFVTTKMREVDDRAKGVSAENDQSSTELESDKAQVSLSIEEINRLLDAEITSIKSRSSVGGLTAEEVVWSRNDMTAADTQTSDNHSENTISISDDALQSVPLPGHSISQTVTMAEVFTEGSDEAANVQAEDGAKGAAATEVKGLLIRKKPETKKLGLSIGAESLARITGNWKNGHFLEDGEVASSTDSDGDRVFKTQPEVEEESEGSDEVSGTGSLSDSDKGKDGKAKKKKKHKHKHKKKKKHKSQSKEKEKLEEEMPADSVEKPSKERKERKTSREKSERKSSKERKEKEDAVKDGKESKSRDRKKGSHHRSKSPESFDPWDARNYRMDANKRKSPSPHSSKSRREDHTKDRHGDRSKERTRGRSKEKHHHSRHKSRSKERARKRSKSREKERGGAAEAEGDKEQADLRVKIDKNKLRKIAIARALANMEKGKGPSVDLTSAKSGGKSVAELTEFCKRISQKEAANDSSDSEVSLEEKGSDGEDGGFHHPFIMRDPSTLPNIVMNIRNAKQLPVLTPQEKQTQAATLRTQFPVSSGTQHRNKESEWVPVTTTTTTTTTITAAATPAKAASSTTSTTASSATGTAMVASGGGGGGVQPGVPLLPTPTPTQMPTVTATATATPTQMPAVPAQDNVFPSVQAEFNIGDIITERIQAMRRLEQNPFDMQALSSVHRINEQTNAWAQSKHLPGQFTGTTDVKILTQEELAGDKRNQAWVKKDQFRRAPPLQGGIGMFLLQKMGWKPGDGLGKDNEGNKEPIMLDVKMDRKGLTTSLDFCPTQPMVRPPPPPLMGLGVPPGVAPVPPRAKDLSGKHPVSALTELCTKRRWGAPAFDLISETGPAHKKMFLFKVRVNGVEYMPTAACGNKKLAKAQAAAVCLQEMGLIPRDFVVQV